MEKKAFNEVLKMLLEDKDYKEFAGAVSQLGLDIDNLTTAKEALTTEKTTLETEKSDLQKKHDHLKTQNDALTSTNSDLESSVATAKVRADDLADESGIIEGTFESKAKKTKGKVYRFKRGLKQFRLPKFGLVQSSEALENSEIMEILVANESGVIEAQVIMDAAVKKAAAK